MIVNNYPWALRNNILFCLEPCPICPQPAVETIVDPNACPVCADWRTGPFGMVKKLSKGQDGNLPPKIVIYMCAALPLCTYVHVLCMYTCSNM